MSENIINKSVLIDGIIALANYFKEHGFNPPTSIEVDNIAFEKILAESAELYNIDSKKSLASIDARDDRVCADRARARSFAHTPPASPPSPQTVPRWN